jgi:outer membrane protein
VKVRISHRFLLLPFVLAAVATAEDIPLSQQKQELLKLQRKQFYEQTETGKTSWVAPLQFSLSYDRSKDVLGYKSDTKNAGVSWSQDLFRSGGIYYTIEQAKASGRANLLSVDRQEASYLKQVYTLKAEVSRDTLKQRQSELTVKNRDIDLFIVKAKYEAGSADISELNRATIDRDNAATELIVVNNTLRSEQFDLKKLVGERPIETIALPDFPLVAKQAYLKDNLELLEYGAQYRADEAAWKVTRSAYLPTLTFDASYGYSDYDGKLQDYDGNRYNYGAVLSMPLDINSRGTIEASRLLAMQTKTLQSDRRMELGQEYDRRYATIGDYEQKIALAEQMIKMYNELYDFTKNQVTAGYKSTYDLESLGNSVQIQKLEKQIQEYNIRVERIALYFDTQVYKEK